MKGTFRTEKKTGKDSGMGSEVTKK